MLSALPLFTGQDFVAVETKAKDLDAVRDLWLLATKPRNTLKLCFQLHI
jgi:hypothetical protein